jgi:hypothetical protein
MDVDFEPLKAPTRIDMHEASEIRFRRLDSEITYLAKEMLRALGESLGIKYGALVVDAFVSDTFEASMGGLSLSGEAYIEWLHEWIGSLAIAKEVSLLLLL